MNHEIWYHRFAVDARHVSGAITQGGPSRPGLHSPPPTMSERGGANRTGAFEPLNPVLVLPHTAMLGTYTPTGRAVEGLELNNQLRDGAPGELHDETSFP